MTNLDSIINDMKGKRIVFSKEQIFTFTKTFTLYNTIIIGIPFVIFWGVEIFEQVENIVDLFLKEGILTYLWVFVKVYLWIMVGLIVGIVSHELIHAITFMVIAKKGFKAIEFGFIEKPFIPYVHFKEKIRIGLYRIGIMMPGILLGIIPCIVGLWVGNIYTASFGVVFTSAAAGDFLVLKATKGIENHLKVRDLPDQIGFEITV